MLHYILQTITFQLLFLIVYDVFLKRETFFNWNRMYLNGTIILSLLLPFLRFESIKAMVPEPMIIRLPEVVIGEFSSGLNLPEVSIGASQPIATQSLAFSWHYVWLAGMFLATFLLVYKIVKIMRLYYGNPKQKQGNLQIVFLVNSTVSFSFFHYIFLGANLQADKKEHILQHELVHVNDKHSWDLLVFELLRIVFWFNPLVYIYQSKVSALHEFIADAKAVKNKNKLDYYQSLLAEVFDTEKISFINPFFRQSLIKKRIMMLSKSRSKQIHLIKYALLAPVILVMLMYTSSYARDIKESLPFLKEEVQNQELPFQDLVDKYYKAITEQIAMASNISEVFRTYFNLNNDNYILTLDEVAKQQALSKFIVDKARDRGTSSESDKNNLEKGIQFYDSYEDYLNYKKTDEAKISWEDKAKVGQLRMVVDNLNELSVVEKERRAKKLELLKEDEFYHTLVLTDGKEVVTLKKDNKDTTAHSTVKIEKSTQLQDIEVPYAIIDKAPLFQGCEPSGSNEADKICTSDKVTQFVNTNFNIGVASENNLKGRQRISVVFKIGKDGKVIDIQARAPHPALEAEAIRVVKSMPDFTPGKQKGKAVIVPFSLPILFQVAEDTTLETNNKDAMGDNTVKGENLPTESNNIEVPYAIIDVVPLFQGCEPSGSKEADRRCTSEKLSQFVNTNYNLDVATENNLKGRQRINVVFKIGKEGKVIDVQARAPHPALEAEAIRVIQSMPDFTPGKHKGKAVIVPYSLPILFQVAEDDSKN